MIPVHIWAIFNVLREIPAWILRMNFWDMIGVVAYTQIFALFESIVLFVLFLLAVVLLPVNWLRKDVVVSSAIIMFALSVWLVVLHFHANWLFDRNFSLLSIWFVTLVVTLPLLLLLTKKRKSMRLSITNLMGRFAVLAAFYLLIDAFSLAIVLFRNLAL